MTPNLDRLIALAIVAVLAGALAGTVLRGKHGFGDGNSFLIGLGGAVFGGWVFTLLNIDVQLGVIRIAIGDVVEALAGALVLLGLGALWGQQRRKRALPKA